MRAVIWGAGGHAAVALDALRGSAVEVVGMIDDIDPDTQRDVMGVPVLGDRSILGSLRESGVSHIHVAVGDCRARLEIAARCSALGFELLRIVHPTAIIGSAASIGDGTLIAAGTVVGPRTRIGRNCIINTGTTVDHDCEIGDGVHLAPGCHLGGHVAIGTLTFIGIGSSLRDRVRVGERAVLGAGSVVVKDIADATLAYGVPARVIRSPSDSGIPTK